MNRKLNKDVINSESSLLNAYNELKSTIDPINQIDVFKPIQIFSQKE